MLLLRHRAGDGAGVLTSVLLSARDTSSHRVCGYLPLPMNLYNEQRRVKHVDHARKSAEQAVRAIKAKESGQSIADYDYLPYYSRSFDVAGQFYGDNAGEDVLFSDNDPAAVKPKFGSYWIKDGRIVGVFLKGRSADEYQAVARVARAQPLVADVEALRKNGLELATKI